MSGWDLLVSVGAGGAALVIAALSSALGSEVHAWVPHLARRLILRATKWRPLAERTDFRDENLDLLESYVEDGRHIAALVIAINECRIALLSFGVRGWLIAEARIESTLLTAVYGSIYGTFFLVLVDRATGLALGLALGLLAGHESLDQEDLASLSGQKLSFRDTARSLVMAAAVGFGIGGLLGAMIGGQVDATAATELFISLGALGGALFTMVSGASAASRFLLRPLASKIRVALDHHDVRTRSLR